MKIGNEFDLSKQKAAASTTWLSDEWVIQQRDARLFEGWKIRMDILESINDPNDLLIASKCQYEKRDGALWVSYKRYDLSASPARFLIQDLTSKQIEDNFKRSLGDILATEELLRSAKKELILPLFWQDVNKVGAARIITDKTVKKTLAYFGVKSNYSLPKDTPMALSHGDAISPNVILTTLGYRLIDWEALSIYPKSLTLSHAICWTILRIPTDRWQRFLKVVLPDCLKTMGLDEDQARLSIYWQVMREALLWARNEERFSEWLKKGEFVFN